MQPPLRSADLAPSTPSPVSPSLRYFQLSLTATAELISTRFTRRTDGPISLFQDAIAGSSFDRPPYLRGGRDHPDRPDHRFMRSSHDMSSSSSSSSSAAAAADDVLFAVGFEGEMDRRQITLHLAIKRSQGGRRGREEREKRGEKRLHRQSCEMRPDGNPRARLRHEATRSAFFSSSDLVWKFDVGASTSS